MQFSKEIKMHNFLTKCNSTSCNFLTEIKMHNFLFLLAQFSLTEIGNFPDNFIPLNTIHNFYNPTTK